MDPANGEKPVYRVYNREEMYSGFNPALIPDMRVANTPNYRVSWQTSLGGAPDQLIQDNLEPWSGDHCSLDPKFVPGIYFDSAPGAPGEPNMMDLAPSILSYFELQPAQEMDGKANF